LKEKEDFAKMDKAAKMAKIAAKEKAIKEKEAAERVEKEKEDKQRMTTMDDAAKKALEFAMKMREKYRIAREKEDNLKTAKMSADDKQKFLAEKEKKAEDYRAEEERKKKDIAAAKEKIESDKKAVMAELKKKLAAEKAKFAKMTADFKKKANALK